MAGIRRAVLILLVITTIGLLIVFAFIVAANLDIDFTLPKIKP